jgi:hypothetical protein
MEQKENAMSNYVRAASILIAVGMQFVNAAFVFSA